MGGEGVWRESIFYGCLLLTRQLEAGPTCCHGRFFLLIDDMLESSARSWSLSGVSIPNVALLQMVFLIQVLNSGHSAFVLLLPSHLGFGTLPNLELLPSNYLFTLLCVFANLVKFW